MSTPKLLFAIAIGVLAGSIFWAGIRTSYYLFLDIHPEMSPMMFIVFAPVIAVVVFVPVALIELILCRVWWRPVRFWQSLTLGFAYSSVLIGLVQPWLLIVLLVANPIVVRLWFIRKRSSA